MMTSDTTVSSQFPPGTPVVVRQVCERREGSYQAEVIGVVESWEDQPTGSWHAHGKDGKLWLKRLRIKKSDGEMSLLIIDDTTEISKIEAAPN